jgi:hypothetical protein
MNRRPSFPTAVCREYEALLHRCKAHLDECRNAADEQPLGNDDRQRKREALARRVERYGRSYAKLKNHFDNCRRCQAARGSRRHYPRVVVTGNRQAR